MKKSIILLIIVSLNSLLSDPLGNAQLELFFDTKNVNNNNIYIFNCFAQTTIWDEDLEITNASYLLASELELDGSTYDPGGKYYNGWDFVTSQGGDDGLTVSYGGVVGYGKYKIELETNTDHYIFVDYRNCQYPSNCDVNPPLRENDIVVFYEYVNNAYKYKWKALGGNPSDIWHTLNFGDTIIIDPCSTPPTTSCFQPTNPSSLNYSVVNNSPLFTWTASYPNNSKYNLFRDNSLIASNISGTNYHDLTVRVSRAGFNLFNYKLNAHLSTADTPTSPGYSNTVTVRRAQLLVKTLASLCDGSPSDSGFVASDCDSSDLSILQVFIDLNNVTPDSCYSCDYNGDGVVDPVEMGEQRWVQGRLVKLLIGQHRGGFSIQQIPNQIDELSSLNHLYLSYNAIASIPSTLWTMDSLVIFYIAVNDLQSISDSVGLLVNLEQLGLYSNDINTIPNTIGNLINMKELYIFDMGLTNVPESLWNLTELTRLDLDSNQLTEIDEGIGNLTNLDELWLSDNYLTELPDGIQNLTNLTSLWIGNNYLYCVNGAQDTSLIPDWLFTSNFLPNGLSDQDCSEMGVEINLPEKFSLITYPNPFNPATTIRFSVETVHVTSLQIYDITGRLVETLIHKPLALGEHEIVWNAGHLPSGVYFVRLQSGEFVESQKVILLK
ncbi:MAG: leucine-rich repeat domain-containing protein [Candidatus Marinimicrobia bacterium]|nr:leucine-rich repeat domain-containing protein [Candidatus Neomarinimicrobiota bacterium]